MDKNIDETMKEAETKLAEIRSAKKELEQERALKAAPVAENRDADKVSEFADVAKAFKEKRAVTLSGTGIVNTVRELVKVMTAKKPILNYVRYFYGADASTVVPVWGSSLTRPQPIGENGTITAETKNPLGTTTLQVVPYAMSIPVSDETLKLSGVAFESELQGILADAYADAIAYEIFNGTGADGHFTNAPANVGNKITEATSGKISIADVANLALAVADKTDAGVIFMNPSIYSAIAVDETNTKEKAWAKDLYNNKRIENVPVVLTSYAPSATEAGATIAIAGDFQNYAVAVAGQLEITPKKTVGALTTTYDVDMYLNGKPVLANNFYGLVTK